MNNILEVKKLNKVYQTINGEITALKDISFNLKDNEFLCIVGSSGCGKSTLLNILANLDNKTCGEINIKNNKQFGYMFQIDALFPWLNVLDNATLGLKIKHIATTDNINYVKELLIKYGLKDFIYKYPNELSGGMRQRVV